MPNITPAEASKLYRERNPERWKKSIKDYQKKKWTCECGSVVSNKMRPLHRKSAKHLHIMSIINKYENHSSDLSSSETD